MRVVLSGATFRQGIEQGRTQRALIHQQDAERRIISEAWRLGGSWAVCPAAVFFFFGGVIMQRMCSMLCSVCGGTNAGGSPPCWRAGWAACPSRGTLPATGTAWLAPGLAPRRDASSSRRPRWLLLWGRGPLQTHEQMCLLQHCILGIEGCIHIIIIDSIAAPQKWGIPDFTALRRQASNLNTEHFEFTIVQLKRSYSKVENHLKAFAW